MTISTQHTDPYLTVVHGEVPAPIGVDGSWDRADWQRMWLRIQTLEWQTLALVPGDDETSTLEVGNLIARLARDHNEPVHVADMRALRPKHVDAFLEAARWEARQGTRIVFVTRSAATNIATVPLARGAHRAILCVSLGSTSLSSIRDTIEQIGREHFLGSLIVRSAAGPSAAKRASTSRRPAKEALP
jgi:hypothetical protein